MAKRPTPVDSSGNKPSDSTKPSIPRIFRPRVRDQKGEALKRYGVDPEAMKGIMQVSKRLAQVSGGHKGCIQALRGDDSDDSVKFIEKYDSITTRDLKVFPLEAVCIMAGITPRRLVEIVSGALISQGDEDTKLIVASYKPKIVAKTAKLAMTSLGEKDREMFHKHTEFIPRPSAPSVNIDQRTQNNTLMAQPERALPPPKADDFLLELSATISPQVTPMLQAPEPVVIAHVPDIEYMSDDV